MLKARDEREAAQNARNVPSPCSHSVQFYEDQSIFLNQLCEFVGSALGCGGACIVIATGDHRRGLAERLEQRVIDIDHAARHNRFIALDAEETLARFMVEGRPDPERFIAAVEPVLLRAKSAVPSPSGSVAAFGEMVALLGESGRYEAAIQLEQLWNDMAHRHSFSLLCAYPISCFAHESQYELFSRVCREHTQVLPTESYTTLATEAERMRMITALQQRAAAAQSVAEERERAIAQRKHIEDKLWRSQEFARKIVESGIDCVKVLDLEGRLEYMSPSGQSAFAISDLSGYFGRNWVEFWRQEDQPLAAAALAAARAGGVGSFQGDCATAQGERKYWDVRIAPARGPDGQIERLIAVSRDISELRQAQQIAIQAEKRAAAGSMAATIAHEINNPLEAVTNFLYLARTTLGNPEEAAHYLEVADRELTRVAQIAQKTLGFYRDTSRKKWLGVGELVDDVMLIYGRKLRNKRLEAKVSVDSGIMVFAKQGEMKQALSNLLANAIDASPAGGSIWLRAQPSCCWTNGMEPGVRIAVADNGSGMAPEVQKRIFTPFFTTKANAGTGIGLWVTKSFIEQQGGYLRFRSRQGPHSGTVMTFFIPTPSRPEIHEVAA